MNTITRRIAATAALLVAPALIALGTATASHAETTTTNHSNMVHAPTQHEAFPHQSNNPKPGTPEHHRHQNHR